MGSKNKQEVVNDDFTFGNISKAKEKFATPKKKKKKGDTVMSIKINKQAYYDFGKLHARFIAETGLFEKLSESKSFLSFTLQEMKTDFETKKSFSEATDSFSKMVKRKGRRPTGERNNPNDEYVPIVFGNYSDDTLSIYNDLMYSLALEDKMEHVKTYSRSYFFYDVISFLETNIKQLIKKNKVKK